MSETATLKEMCDEIVRADFLRKKDGTAPDAREVYSYSPNGELYMIIAEWYPKAVLINNAKNELNDILKKGITRHREGPI